MDLLIIIDGVSDYDSWRKIFDEDAGEREKFSTSMESGPIDNNKVSIVAYGVDMEAMGAFMSTPEFAERTKSIQSGVTLYQLTALAP